MSLNTENHSHWEIIIKSIKNHKTIINDCCPEFFNLIERATLGEWRLDGE